MPFFHYLRYANGSHPITLWDRKYLSITPEARFYQRNLLVHYYFHATDSAHLILRDSSSILEAIPISTLEPDKALIVSTTPPVSAETNSGSLIEIKITNCQKSIIMPFESDLNSSNHQFNLERKFHTHPVSIKKNELEVKILDHGALTIEAHIPLLIDIPEVVQHLTSNLSVHEKVNRIHSYLHNTASRASYISHADAHNFESFQLSLNEILASTKGPDTTGRVDLIRKSGRLKKTRKILMFSHEDSRTGAPIYLLQIATELISYGYDVHVTSIRPDLRNGNFSSLGSRHSYLQDYIDNSERKESIISYWLLTKLGERAMLRLIKKMQPDLVIVNSLASADAVRMASVCDIPCILYVHEAWRFEGPYWTTKYPFALRVKESLEAAQLVFFGSKATQRHWLSSGFGINSQVAPSYRDIEVPPHEIRQRMRLDYRSGSGIREGETVFLAVATFESRKRIEDIVAAFKLLKNDGVFLWLVGASESPSDDSTRELIGLDSRIRVIPATGELDPYYAAADCFIFASIEETMPLVLQEAATWEIPRIVSRYSGYNELIPNDDYALLFTPMNIQELLALMNSFLSGEIEWNSMTCKAKDLQSKFVEDSYDILLSGIDLVSKSWTSVVPKSWYDEKG
jgi:glycosyltransferase involved in cell wall biosynthesis